MKHQIGIFEMISDHMYRVLPETVEFEDKLFTCSYQIYFILIKYFNKFILKSSKYTCALENLTNLANYTSTSLLLLYIK